MSYQGQQPQHAINPNTGNDMNSRSVTVERQQLTRPKKAVLNIPQPVLNNLIQPSKSYYALGANKNKEFNNNGTTTESSISQDRSCFDVKQANKAIYNHDLMNSLLLRRFKNLHSRPKYSVRIDLEKLKPDPVAEVTRVNAAQTYFYNTIPTKKTSFTIDPNFASESILDYRRSKNCNNLTKFRRDYAFVY